MAYKSPYSPEEQKARRSARRKELKRLKAGKKTTNSRAYNPGPWKSPAALITEPALPPTLSRVDRAQVAAYGYAGALCPRGI